MLLFPFSALRASALLVLVAALLHQPVEGLNIAITGSSQGIGLDAAKRLIAEGHTVYHACRNEERANVAVQDAGGGIPMICDLGDLTSVRTFATELVQQEPALDVLCLNAGMAPSTKATIPQLTKDGFEECIGVNHLGHFLLANLLQDRLAENKGRLITTASSVHDPEAPGGAVGGKGGATLGDLSGLRRLSLDNAQQPTMPDGATEYDGGKIYKDSKLCNVLFCNEAFKRWSGGDKNKEVSIRSFNPGFIPSSGLFRAPRKDNWFAASAFTFVASVVGFSVPIEVGGQRLAYMATADEAEIPSGSYFSAPEAGSKAITKADGFDQASISAEASNDELALRLWDISADLVGLEG